MAIKTQAIAHFIIPTIINPIINSSIQFLAQISLTQKISHDTINKILSTLIGLMAAIAILVNLFIILVNFI
ncbi:hypothetical protein LU293_07030 [Moraxella nasovis]|uniref:hypothetical protein n=1 Tax=Moraxella nasovis TaxID=2904121 RepID=UPI001F61C296|nr:hypothetical protein [Moraxella nasovis]UNU72845.1 hypothetical protein LU293_07030 [Moraxella nasovis]